MINKTFSHPPVKSGIDWSLKTGL